jgi:hypothetical protein
MDRQLRPRAAAIALAAGLLTLAFCSGGGSSVSSAAAPAASPPSVQTLDRMAPTNVLAAATSPISVALRWTAATDNVGVTAYRVYRDNTVLAKVASTSYTDTGPSAGTTDAHQVVALDATGNSSTRSATASMTPPASGKVISATAADYLTKLAALNPGDTLLLAAGNYGVDANGQDTAEPPGLPIFNLNGTASQPITITGPDTGPRPVMLGRSTHNTIRFDTASYVVVRNIDVDGRSLGEDAVKSQGVSHHITIEGLHIKGVDNNQQIVGISTKATVWNWVIRHNTIVGAGTGMYLGNSNGSCPFIAGTIENNLIYDTIGYNIEIKHQNPRPALAGMPTGRSSTIIRGNVFSKSAATSSTDGLARPNLLVGHLPLSGSGATDLYEIYGNFFYQNPTEALFQAEGNVAFHDNVLVNDIGGAIHIQPHNDVPKLIRIFSNTVIARDDGISVSGGSTAYTQVVEGNVIFANAPIAVSGLSASATTNVTDNYAAASIYLNAPTAALGTFDAYPKTRTLRATALDTTGLPGFTDWNLDFNGMVRDWTVRGAYAGDGTNPGWLPKLAIKP